jgi:phosphate starvation-inducible PhoH-like protein
MTLEHGRTKRVRRTKEQIRVDKVNEGGRQIKEKFLEERKAIPPVQAKNDFQRRVLKALATKQVVVISAPAGVGKSFLTMSAASDDLVKGVVDKIFLARPAVGMGNSLGMLKGTLREKYEPYLMSLIEVLIERHGRGVYESGLNTGSIELIPFEYMRGRNLGGLAIVDEVQGCSATEIYSVLTRITEGGKLVLLGDKTQSDLKGIDGMSWLHDFVDRHNLHDTVEFIEGSSDDIVRSGFVKAIVKAKEKDTGIYSNKWEKPNE